MKKQKNSTYLTAIHLLENKKSYIHDLKRKTKANNPMQRIASLRQNFGWEIDTIYEGNDGRRAIYFYKVINKGAMPAEYL